MAYSLRKRTKTTRYNQEILLANAYAISIHQDLLIEREIHVHNMDEKHRLMSAQLTGTRNSHPSGRTAYIQDILEAATRKG